MRRFLHARLVVSSSNQARGVPQNQWFSLLSAKENHAESNLVSKLVDLSGIGPEIRLCHSRALPLRHRPLTKSVYRLSKTRTIPASASTSTVSPSFRTSVANRVPMMQGFCNSRATIAACELIPPSFVTIAAPPPLIRK